MLEAERIDESVSWCTCASSIFFPCFTRFYLLACVANDVPHAKYIALCWTRLGASPDQIKPSSVKWSGVEWSGVEWSGVGWNGVDRSGVD